jgi:ribonuclease P protein component
LKLRTPNEFSFVFNYKKKITSPHLFIHFCPNDLGVYRLGFIVSKKSESLAVKRNYMRRSIREIIKNQLSKPFSFDMIIRVRKSFYKDSFDDLNQEIKTLIASIK